MAGEKRVLCYYESWAVYNEGPGEFQIRDIDPQLCTHIVYSFAGLGSDNKLKVLDEYNDLSDDGGLGE